MALSVLLAATFTGAVYVADAVVGSVPLVV